LKVALNTIKTKPNHSIFRKDFFFFKSGALHPSNLFSNLQTAKKIEILKNLFSQIVGFP
jgi:hypothetical protein